MNELREVIELSEPSESKVKSLRHSFSKISANSGASLGAEENSQGSIPVVQSSSKFVKSRTFEEKANDTENDLIEPSKGNIIIAED